MHTTEATPSFDQRNHRERGSRATRRGAGLLRWAIFAFPVWLALAPAPAGAAMLGSRATNANIFMPMNSWTTLNFIPVPAANVWRYCIAVGSADVHREGVGAYLFTLTLDDPQPPMNEGQERTVQFVAGGPVIKEVTTTQGFALSPHMAHLIRWLGRPDPGSPGTGSDDNSMSVVCDPGNGNLGIFNANPEPTPED